MSNPHPFRICPKCHREQSNAKRVCVCGHHLYIKVRRKRPARPNKAISLKKCLDCDEMVSVAYKTCPHCEYVFIPGGVRLSPGECGQVMTAQERKDLEAYIAKRKAIREAKHKTNSTLVKEPVKIAVQPANIFDVLRPIEQLESKLAPDVRLLVRRLKKERS